MARRTKDKYEIFRPLGNNTYVVYKNGVKVFFGSKADCKKWIENDRMED
jgi:hypothetical protein